MTYPEEGAIDVWTIETKPHAVIHSKYSAISDWLQSPKLILRLKASVDTAS